MNLYLYLAGALLGVGLLVGLNLLLMGRTVPRVDLEAAGALLAGEVPGFRSGRAVLSRDGAVALIEDAGEDGGGVLFLVAAAGDTLVSRKLARGSVRGVVRQGAVLSIDFDDLTFPSARFSLADAAQAADWEQRVAEART